MEFTPEEIMAHMPTLEDLKFLNDFLTDLDMNDLLGKCEDYMHEDDYCKMCTMMQKFLALEFEVKEGNVEIKVKDS